MPQWRGDHASEVTSIPRFHCTCKRRGITHVLGRYQCVLHEVRPRSRRTHCIEAVRRLQVCMYGVVHHGRRERVETYKVRQYSVLLQYRRHTINTEASLLALFPGKRPPQAVVYAGSKCCWTCARPSRNLASTRGAVKCHIDAHEIHTCL